MSEYRGFSIRKEIGRYVATRVLHQEVPTYHGDGPVEEVEVTLEMEQFRERVEAATREELKAQLDKMPWWGEQA